MNSKSSCSPQDWLEISMRRTVPLAAELIFCALTAVVPARAGDAPQWMHALVSMPLPAHDEKTNAVLLYSARTVVVQSADKIKTTVREAYKVLRAGGREYRMVAVYYNSHEKITGMRCWCTPPLDKEYGIKEKD